MNAASSKPPVCLHEPIIRQGIKAAIRLARGGAEESDLESLLRAHELLDRSSIDSTDCYEARVSEMRATIAGLREEVFQLRESLRAAESARDRALRSREECCEHGFPDSLPCRDCASLVRDL